MDGNKKQSGTFQQNHGGKQKKEKETELKTSVVVGKTETQKKCVEQPRGGQKKKKPGQKDH